MQMVDTIGALAPAAPAPAPTVDSCAAGGDDSCTDPVTAQNLRIAAVFIILASSTLGIWLPVIAGEISYLQKPLAQNSCPWLVSAQLPHAALSACACCAVLCMAVAVHAATAIILNHHHHPRHGRQQC